MNEELKQIFGTEITVGSSKVPVAHLRYRGDSKTLVTWTITGDEPTLAGDDELLYSVVSVDIDVFSDKNYLNVVEAIKELMILKDWVWTGDSSEMFEEDTGLYQLTCSFEKERSL